MKGIFLTILLGFISMSAEAKVLLEKVEYKSGDKTFEGVVAYDSSLKGKKAGVIVFPNWMGIASEAESKITELAKLGYVAMAADLYGKGTRPKDAKEAGELSTILKNDRQLLRERSKLALATLAKNSKVDSSKLLAVGYCFGGTAALELGRSGADVLGIVTFHGALSNPTPADAKNIKAQVEVYHGEIDPFVTVEEVAAFKKEMDEAKVTYSLTVFSGAVHSFTDSGAGHDITKGQAYNAIADRRSWEGMKSFFHELTK
ncbi:MAG: dienelactone hydrolase family protein [Bacteriovorax sp.]|nr:dienelactone hydrolase family protein [Bacteriovorax sp.]